MYGPMIDYYRITIQVKCFNDNCGHILTHNYPSYDDTPRMDGVCPNCNSGYSVKVNNIKDRIVHRHSEAVYR